MGKHMYIVGYRNVAKRKHDTNTELMKVHNVTQIFYVARLLEKKTSISLLFQTHSLGLLLFII